MLRLEERPPRGQEALEVAAFREWTQPDGTSWLLFHRCAAGYLLRFPGLADFEVPAEGVDIRCWAVPGVSEHTIRHLFQNQVWPLALSRSKGLIFHGSAVEVAKGCVAFVADSGRGKSTLASAFATHGFPFLSDDGLVLKSVEGLLHVLPSFPSIRLWQDSQEALLAETALATQDVTYTSKFRMLAGDDLPHCPESRPLSAVFFLGNADVEDPEITRMKPGDALIELVKHSFLLDIEKKELLAHQFDELARMVNEPIYFRLDYPRRYADLPRVRQAILKHVDALSARAESPTRSG